MKTIISITICIGLLVASGCANYDWSSVGQALGEYGRQQQEIANQQNAQLRESGREMRRQLQQKQQQQSTYWQEQRVRQEYYRSLGYPW